ncbi:CtsR family transcriptional regulator [Limnochorda pilosa]|uniref:Transcriptional regulator n=1 Tax=Limnochorda pilosa TaxID=1555112 RepID=A0A0K2SQN2_LIMPI|nr:CtsR family transcriptional regulator [Limnochorda pilosa]BAS29124.1 transcriptional regulator [Limnochorda pilosa]
MATLAEQIEAHLKRMLAAASGGVIEIQRREVARLFACVPSQINYVLETRFTPDHGYRVESRRGGGGYIRITWLAPWEATPRAASGCPSSGEPWASIGSELDRTTAETLLRALEARGWIGRREGGLVRAALEAATEGLGPGLADRVRAQVLRSLLMVVLN